MSTIKLGTTTFIKAGDNIVDCFFDDGWENWARILRKDGKLIHLKGMKVPKIIYSFIEKELFSTSRANGDKSIAFGGNKK